MTFYKELAILLQSKKKVMFKNIFPNKKYKNKMSTENTELDQEIDDTTLENNANGEQIIVEEPVALSVEEQLTQDLATEKDKYIRLFAEFENYKRRTTKERIESFKTANQEVLQALLPVVDDFDRAMIEIKKN